MVTSGWQNAVKFTHVISKGSRQQLVLCNVAAFFTRRALEGKLGTQSILQGNSGIRRVQGHLGTEELAAVKHAKET